MRQWRRRSNIILIAMNAKNEMRMYLLMSASPLMRMAQCSASGTTLIIGAPGPCGSCSCASSQSNLIRGIGTFRQLSFQGVRPVMFSISPLMNRENWALTAGSSSGFLMVLVLAGGAPPLPPLPLPGFLVPRCMVACNLHLLKETLRYKIMDWPNGQSSRVVGKW